MRRRLMIEQGELPSGYVRLNYIENTGEAYIATGYINDSNTHPSKVVVDFAYTDASVMGHIFGVSDNAAGKVGFDRYGFAFSSYSEKFSFLRIGTSGAWVSFGAADTNRHLFEYVHQEGIYFDGVLQESTVEAANRTVRGANYPIGIFALMRQFAPAEYALAKIYSFQLWDETGLARNYVPVQRKKDGEIGMYETITKTFHANSGTGSFMGG
jgi:hypothetical protein